MKKAYKKPRLFELRRAVAAGGHYSHIAFDI